MRTPDNRHGAEDGRFRVAVIPTAAAAVLVLAGCTSAPQTSAESSASSTASTTPTATSAAVAAPIELRPNLSGFVDASDSALCHNGASRPCAVLIRLSPHLTSDYVNADPSQKRVSWPLEAYGSEPGDAVAIRCYEPNGDAVRAYVGNSQSTVWYQVIVPPDHVQNKDLQARLQQGDSSLATIQFGGQTALLGHASVEWFGQSAPDPAVPRC